MHFNYSATAEFKVTTLNQKFSLAHYTMFARLTDLALYVLSVILIGTCLPTSGVINVLLNVESSV